MNGKEIKFIDMFGGVGGFRLGLERASERFKCVGYYEIEEHAVKIYNKNFKEQYEPRNVRDVDWSKEPNFDMLCAGFPCQSFSIGGKRKGMDEARGTLFFEIIRAIKEKNPKTLLLENVKGLLNHDRGQTFRTILRTLDAMGYDVEWSVLNSQDFKAPQNRPRVYMLCSLRNIKQDVKQRKRKTSPILFELCADVASRGFNHRQKLRNDARNGRVYANFSSWLDFWSFENMEEVSNG